MVVVVGGACLLKYNLSSNVPPSLCPQTEYLDFCDGVQQRFCLAWKVSHSEALREHTRAHTPRSRRGVTPSGA